MGDFHRRSDTGKPLGAPGFVSDDPWLRRVGKLRRRRGGASLLEVVIATLIVGLLAIAIVGFFAKGRIWFDQEERKRVATLLAQESVERTIAKAYPAVSGWSENRRVEATTYAIAVTVQANTPEANLKTIRSVVSWRATPTAQRSVSLATVVYNN